MGAEGAVGIIFRDELAAGRRSSGEAAKRLTREYEDTFANPYVAAGPRLR